MVVDWVLPGSIIPVALSLVFCQAHCHLDDIQVNHKSIVTEVDAKRVASSSTKVPILETKLITD